MIMISSEAGVRMAKAGKALEDARKSLDEAPANDIDIDDLDLDVTIAESKYADAVEAVLAELYKQNLHEMTGP